MEFREYYTSAFREDLSAVLRSAPASHEHAPGEVTIQPKSISRLNPVIAGWADDQRALFAAGLFLTILSDQVCYTHFGEQYPSFRSLTQYPKWRGDCPGGCAANIHPEVIFATIGQLPGSRPKGRQLSLGPLPKDVIATMEHEVKDFAATHLPAVNPQEFWDRYDAEISPGVRMLYFSRHES